MGSRDIEGEGWAQIFYTTSHSSHLPSDKLTEEGEKGLIKRERERH